MQSLKNFAIDMLILLPIYLAARWIADIDSVGTVAPFLAGWIGGCIGLATLMSVDRLRTR